MFWVKVNLDGIEHKFDTMANSARDLEKPLAIFGGYMKKKALKKYEAQDFAPLAASTLAARASKGVHSLERKLSRDVKRATKKSTEKLGGDALAAIQAVSTRGVRNRLAVLAEFQRRHPATYAARAGGVMAGAGLKPLSFKQAVSLNARTDRAVARAVGKPILGNLTRSLTVEVGSGSMTLASRTAEGWSEVHNEGGTAGHGAAIPERRTIEVEPSDLSVLTSILQSYLLLPFQKGAHGPGF